MPEERERMLDEVRRLASVMRRRRQGRLRIGGEVLYGMGVAWVREHLTGVLSVRIGGPRT